MMRNSFEAIAADETAYETDTAEFKRAVHVARVASNRGFAAGLEGGDALLAACETMIDVFGFRKEEPTGAEMNEAIKMAVSAVAIARKTRTR